MKSPFQINQCFTGRTAAIMPLFVAMALAFTGCATRKQVAEIVTQSNAAMLAGQFGLPDPHGTGGAPGWQMESDRIDAFIAAHPDQPTATAPLRIRQGMLLLTHGQYHLAGAAFDQASEDDLHTARDQALKRNQETLLWWFANSTNHTWTTDDQALADRALTNLKEEQSRLAASPEIRDYLAELRAWIGLSAARQTTSTNRMRERIEETLNVYSQVFTPDDLLFLAGESANEGVSKALPVDIRRRLRAKAVLDAAKELNQTRNLGARPKAPVFDEWIQRQGGR
jgi:hypothetical protein